MARDGLRATSLVALVVGAIGSLGLWIHAAQHPPLLIIALFVVWVFSPFVILGIGHLVGKRWAPGTQAALYWVTLLVALASLLIYADDSVAHRTSRPAFVYVVVPPASVLVSAIAVGIAALTARKNSLLR
jgi:hypothetical protein